MKIQVKKIGQGKYNKWCTFSAYSPDSHLSFVGIANFDDSVLTLKEKTVYDLELIISFRKDRTVFTLQPIQK